MMHFFHSRNEKKKERNILKPKIKNSTAYKRYIMSDHECQNCFAKFWFEDYSQNDD